MPPVSECAAGTSPEAMPTCRWRPRRHRQTQACLPGPAASRTVHTGVQTPRALSLVPFPDFMPQAKPHTHKDKTGAGSHGCWLPPPRSARGLTSQPVELWDPNGSRSLLLVLQAEQEDGVSF